MITRSVKIMGLCLVAAFVASVVAVASASAAGSPLFLFPAGGTKPQFSSVSGPVVFVQKASAISEENGAELKCTSGTDTGEIAGDMTDRAINVVVTFKGCTAKVALTTYTCQSGAVAGEIKSNKLEGQLGYISEAAKTVGLMLKPQAPATLFAEFECTKGAEKFKNKIRGELIGEITPVNKLVDPGEHFTLRYVPNAVRKWEQVPNELTVLGQKKTALLLETSNVIVSGGAFLFSAIETTDEVFPLQSTEIMA